MDSPTSDKVLAALETFRIELPSWGFANTGTRFGKFLQPAAATTTEEKFSDAGQVHLLTLALFLIVGSTMVVGYGNYLGLAH